MSWQAYVDSSLMAGGALSQACMIGRQDAQVWGQTPGFGPKTYDASIVQEDGSEKTENVNEAKDLPIYANTHKKTGHGFRINGVKYTTVRTYENNEFGDFVVYGAKGTQSGVCMVVTKQCIIIGVWDKKVNPNHIAATCNSTCENLGKYLMGMNY
eukprot:INCI19041.1.p2 GENE.INCI19041.1~~INCI19041.1.p2  ORF type:complete len:155 (+),score=24.66 INCI19041.1:178-642(+)